jgi:hypothetical protein
LAAMCSDIGAYLGTGSVACCVYVRITNTFEVTLKQRMTHIAFD